MTRLLVAVVVVALLSAVGWWFGLYQPAREQQAALDAEIAELQTQETQLSNQVQQLRELELRAPQLRSDLDRLSAYIPPDPDQARLLELLQDAGNAAGVTFTALSFTDPQPVVDAPLAATPTVALGAVTVTGAIESTYFQLMDFLRRLEIGSSRAILVTQVGLTEGEDGFPALTATFTAQIFALVPAPLDPNAQPEVEVEVEATPLEEGAARATAPPDPDGAQSAPPEDEVQVSMRGEE